MSRKKKKKARVTFQGTPGSPRACPRHLAQAHCACSLCREDRVVYGTVGVSVLKAQRRPDSDTALNASPIDSF